MQIQPPATLALRVAALFNKALVPTAEAALSSTLSKTLTCPPVSTPTPAPAVGTAWTLAQMIPWHKAFSLAVAMLLCSCRDDPPSHTANGRISLEVTNSLAIPNHRVALSVSADQLSVTRQNKDSAQLVTSKELTAEELAAVWTSVDAVNWSAVKKDKVLGLDGTTYRISFGDEKFIVWTPESDTESRDLTRLIELKTLLWRIAEIKQGEQDARGNRR